MRSVHQLDQVEGETEKDLKFLVVKGDGPSLLVVTGSSLDNILRNHATLFKEELRSIINKEAEVILPRMNCRVYSNQE